ncbi:calponin [Fusarium heterosporum]|uniref:Calponin n=1 Tax=Fusarium heterosporum TaxID=42747 RepID=A0A8H5X1F4_FUSHE|nr:calponin [Fusarium heterosporum]
MASVSSLDKDLRKMRLEKYTPAAANEARTWIEDILGESLPSSDLLEGLKDGVALCKLANLALPPPGVRFKKSAMPFVQMENISLFLRACQSPPLNLQQHDTFLTVDLFEQKDPTQVLQCIVAFSRAACAANPRNFPTSIGPKTRPDTVTPQGTGTRTPTSTRDRGASFTGNKSPAFGRSAAVPHRTGDSGSGRWSPTKSPRNRPESPSAVSSWSKKEHEGTTSPAWNIAQYGYLGGASQGNLGISFGGRRQITNAGPRVPSLAEKERRRKDEEERARQEAEEEERRQAQEEEYARSQEESRWEEEAEQLREQERQEVEEEKRRWEEEERQWKLTEEQRRKEEEAAEARLIEERKALKNQGDSKLTGQFLSQYQTSQGPSQQDGASEDDYKNRVKQLEQELELARQREAEYERERQERVQRHGSAEVKPLPKPKPKLVSSPPTRSDSWSRDEREVLRTRSPFNREPMKTNNAPVLPSRSPRPLPDPTALPQVKSPNLSSRPLPDPATYSPKPAPALPNRTDRFLSSNPAPSTPPAQTTYSRELGATAERDAEDQRRAQSQIKTKAGGMASKSLLEREMEMERQRQREWEDAQKETAAAVRSNDGVEGIGGGIGGRWDVGQWAGYTGGDSQNKGSVGIGAGRRQIVGGPRPLPEQPR